MWSHVEIIAQSSAFSQLLRKAAKVAKSPASVLVTGESGTGKECVVRFIHAQSARRDKPFIAVNCAAIPENLIESELFGFAKGAFSGATTTKRGLFEEAEGGTLFLDEIGELNLSLQAKLLRVLQERKLRRLGEGQERKLDIRIVTATNQDLKSAVAKGTFREDLYFRLNVVPLQLSPLRERKEDILPLAKHFLKKFSDKYQLTCPELSGGACEFLQSQTWKGNVRELQNLMERVLILCEKNWILEGDLKALAEESDGNDLQVSTNPPYFWSEQEILSLEDLTQRYIEYVLKINKGAKEKTAKDLGIDRKTLYRRLQSPDHVVSVC